MLITLINITYKFLLFNLKVRLNLCRSILNRFLWVNLNLPLFVRRRRLRRWLNKVHLTCVSVNVSWVDFRCVKSFTPNEPYLDRTSPEI